MKRTKYKFGTGNLKNNLINVQGPKHEGGGVQLSPQVEVEGGEAIFNNMVFSDTLKTKDGMTFAEAANAINKRLSKDSSDLGTKTLDIELKRLMKSQETLKAEQGIENPVEGGEEKMLWGGVIAGAAGGLINMARSKSEKPREYDPIELERAEWNDAKFDTVSFDEVDYGEQRNLASLTGRRNTNIGNATIRSNARGSGQLLGNMLANNANNRDAVNRVHRESFMTEENTNVGIRNNEDLTNTNILNSQEQFNVGGRNRTNMFNTEIGNNEILQNFQIEMENARNEDAQKQMYWDGIGQVLTAGGVGFNGMAQKNADRRTLGALGNLSPEQLAAIYGR